MRICDYKLSSGPWCSPDVLDTMAFDVPTHIPQRLLGQQPPENAGTVVHWFRIGSLRLSDNPAFNYAVTSGLRFKAIFIVDPWFECYSNGPSVRPAVNVWRFLLESLHDLDNKLQKIPYQTRLNVFVGQPTTILPVVFRRWNVSKLTFQASQISYEAKKHDEIIQRIATDHNVDVAAFYSHTLYNPNDLFVRNSGRVPVTYKEFRRLLAIMGCPQEPIPEPNPSSVLMSCEDSSSADEVEGVIPTLQSLGFDPSEKLYTNHWVGGETEALNKLPNFGAQRVSLSDDPIEWLMNKDSLSPYIRFGCFSVRQLFSQLRQLASTSLKGQALFEELTKNLLLREFAFLVGFFTPNFDLMEGNPLCVQFPWDDNPQYLEAWRQGQTGYPWIDAVIRQCRRQGWAHFLGRQSIAVFMTRGYMWLNWVLGKEFFQEFNLDFQQPLSSVAWMQSACSGFFCNQVESYNPCVIGKQMDMDGHFIKIYVPELKAFPVEYIHEPWKAPLHIQQEAGCIIGMDYPKPTVDVCNQEELCCKRIQAIMTALYEVYAGTASQ